MRQLTRKQNAFVKHLIDNPKDSATKAVLATYGGKASTAGSIASENLKKPQIVAKLEDMASLAEETLLGVMTDWKRDAMPRKRELAMQSAMYVHDKVHGKATQRVEMQSSAVVISVDMSGSMLSDSITGSDATE